MLLKHIYLYLNLDEYPDELSSTFGFRTRYICNFIERSLKRLRFHTEDFSKICVQGTDTPEESCPVRFENAANPTVKFDLNRYKALGPNEHHEFFIAMLLEGIEKCGRHHSIPLGSIKEAIQDFRHLGYRNEWIHQVKLLRQAGLRASLICSLDSSRFLLTLLLERHGEIIYRQPVLETKPDELIFAYKFKEVALEDDTVVVLNKFGKPTFSIDLEALAR